MWTTRSQKAETKLLGDFQVESGEVFVSDPCYDLDTWCAKVVENVKNGTWLAEIDIVKEWGKRVSKLKCYHESVKYPGSLLFKEVDADIGVDSGQAGIFDINHFKKDSDVEGLPRDYKERPICENEPWYSYCCDRTLTKMADVIPFGVVSSSGLGDGSYKLEVAKKDDEVVGMQVTFLEEEEDNNDEEEDEEDE